MDPRLVETADLDTELLPLAAAATADLRELATATHYPRNRLLRILADVADADGEIVAARYLGKPEAAAAAVLRRHALLADLSREREKAAESFLSMLALAAERRPEELQALLVPVLAKLFGKTWDAVTERLTALETITAEQLEYSR